MAVSANEPRFSRYAKATFKKDRRLNIRLSSKDLEAIQNASQNAAVRRDDGMRSDRVAGADVARKYQCGQAQHFASRTTSDTTVAARANAGTVHRVGMDRPMMSIARREVHARPDLAARHNARHRRA